MTGLSLRPIFFEAKTNKTHNSFERCNCNEKSNSNCDKNLGRKGEIGAPEGEGPPDGLWLPKLCPGGGGASC